MCGITASPDSYLRKSFMSRASKSRARADIPLSELKTFLLADVRGYTRFTQEYGDEMGARLAANFAQVAREGVGARGGVVVELRGDEAVAAFSSARQALQAAIDLQAMFAAETASTPDLPLRVGIGIDAGEVVPVEGGFRGGALNLAARLSSLAGPGEVLASEGAVHLARRIKGLEYCERGLVELKGFAERVRVIRVVPEGTPLPDGHPTKPASTLNGNGHGSELDEAPLPIGGFLGALPEGLLVARDEEFDRILAAIKAVEGGFGRLVLLAGEPGVGKTRLAQEVTLKARNHSFIMATGRCYEPESTVPFYPFLEALATLHAVCPADVREMIPRRWPEVQSLLPNSGAAANAGSDGSEEQQRLFWAVTGFLQAVSHERPVVLLLDDLHWADATSLELLQHLARHTRANRILLVGAYRDVEVNRQHPLEAALRDLGRERLVEEIEIRRLDEQGTAELMAATLGGSEIAPEFVHLVHRHTDGNAFFVEEVVRTLVERGDVYREDGRWQGRSLEDLEIPKSVRSVVGQRLSRLSDESQEILREASVLGPAFSFEDLAGMCGRDEAELERALEEAVAAGLVGETGRDAYAFNHALTQGTLYAELPSRRRRRLHLAAAKSLEGKRDADEHANGRREQDGRSERRGHARGSGEHRRFAELAWHFLEGDDPERALLYSLAAGKEARRLFAYDEAERHFRTSVELAVELGDQTHEAAALAFLGIVLRTVAKYEEAIAVLERAAALQRAIGDAEGERWTTANIGRAHSLAGSPTQGIERIRRLLSAIDSTHSEDDAEPVGALSGLAALYAALAGLFQETEQSAEQLEAAERALEISRRAEGSSAGARIQVEGQMWRAAALAELGDLEDARRMLEDIVPLAEDAGDPMVLSRALNTLAMIYSEAGQYDKERKYVEHALTVAEQMGDPARLAFMNNRLGWHLVMVGQWHEGRTYLEQSLAISRTLGWTATLSWTLTALGILASARGEEETADVYFDEAIRLSERSPRDPTALALALWALAERYLGHGRVADALRVFTEHVLPATSDWNYMVILPPMAAAHLESGDTEQAETLARHAIELARAERNRSVLADALRVLGLVLARAGCREEAAEALNEALGVSRAIAQPFQEARVLEAMGTVAQAAGEAEAAVDYLRQSHALYEGLGALRDSARTQAVILAQRPSEDLVASQV